MIKDLTENKLYSSHELFFDGRKLFCKVPNCWLHTGHVKCFSEAELSVQHFFKLFQTESLKKTKTNKELEACMRRLKYEEENKT